MSACDLIRRLHQHRMWVNHRLLEAVPSLSEEQLRQPLAIGQGSVWRTLTHLLTPDAVGSRQQGEPLEDLSHS